MEKNVFERKFKKEWIEWNEKKLEGKYFLLYTCMKLRINISHKSLKAENKKIPLSVWNLSETKFLLKILKFSVTIKKRKWKYLQS